MITDLERLRNLSVLNRARGFTLWHYDGDGDTLENISAVGFFDPAGNNMRIGDMVVVSTTMGGRVLVIAATGETVRTEALR